MKKTYPLLYLFGALLASITSCKKDDTEPTRSPIVVTPPVTSTGSDTMYFKVTLPVITPSNIPLYGDFKYTMSNVHVFIIRKDSTIHEAIPNLSIIYDANTNLTFISNFDNTPVPILMKVGDGLYLTVDSLETSPNYPNGTNMFKFPCLFINKSTHTGSLAGFLYQMQMYPNNFNNQIDYGSGSDSWGTVPLICVYPHIDTVSFIRP